MLQMLRGRHLFAKPLPEQDWMVFWSLVQDMDGVIEEMGLTALTVWKQG